MILNSADIRKLGDFKIIIWFLFVTKQYFKRSMHVRLSQLEPEFSSIRVKQTKNLKTQNKLYFNSDRIAS
jgi:hypothetical protein